MTEDEKAAEAWVAKRYWDASPETIAMDRKCGIEDFLAGVEHGKKRLREAFEAGREQEMYNANDPDGNRQRLESDYPLVMRSIGFAVGHRQKWNTFEDWEKSIEELPQEPKV